MFTQAVRSVPKFARYHIVDENGEDVDWILALAGLLHRDDLKSTSKMAIATALQQIGTKKAVALIGDASEK